MKNKSGITLIALVVTIVVLLILAGVSISMLTGENGIITQAQEAKKANKEREVEEKVRLALIAAKTAGLGKIDFDTLNEELDKIGYKGPNITNLETEAEVEIDEIIVTIDKEENIKIIGSIDSIVRYNIAFIGENITSNGASTIRENKSYTTDLILANGYGVYELIVKMGDTVLTENTEYTYSNGTLIIPNVNANVEIQVSTLRTIEGNRTAELTYFDEQTTLMDSEKNLIKVPEGFKIAEDSGINVTEGIIIEDNDIVDGIANNRGNQYVWIPVGEGIKKSDGTTVDITLGRYTFDSSGAETLVQDAESYAAQTAIKTYFKELTTSRTGTSTTNTTALDLKGFIDSVNSNGGYYIARYEASYGTDGKANSKITSNFSTSTAPTSEGTLWNFITQINAAKASRDLYTTATTDLMNSYAWDTAILYMQEFSGDTDYSYQYGTSINASLTNTGTNKDEVCKINDMSSNSIEWTTEYSSDSISGTVTPCAYRGGDYYASSDYTSFRGSLYATTSDKLLSFRSIIYM